LEETIMMKVRKNISLSGNKIWRLKFINSLNFGNSRHSTSYYFE
jgi:hypothetical protein